MNNGADQAADFFPVSRFRSTYYQPDVLAKVLETQDEERALRLANEESGRKRPEASLQQMLPPVVEIISPKDGEEVAAAAEAEDMQLQDQESTPEVENEQETIDKFGGS